MADSAVKVESSTTENASQPQTNTNLNGGGQQHFNQRREGGRGGHEGGRGGHEGGRGGHEGGRGGHEGGRGGFDGGRGGRFGGKRRNQGNFESKPRFNRGGDNQQQGGGDFNPQRQSERIMYDKLMEMGNNPTFELPVLENEEKKFSGRSRLYIGNIPNDADDEEVIELFKSYGETNELFLNREKNFGFIRMDYHFNAERAKNEINGKVLKGRTLKIRFAPNSSTIKVKNLDEYVTNELLYHAFSVFGEIDRAVVIVDDHGKSIGEGIVEFARKNTAQFALRKCSEGCFFLTSSVRPVFVEPYEAHDEMDGYSDKFVPKRNPEFAKQRKVGPRFAQPDSFEQEYGTRWKQLHDLYKQKVEALKKEQEIEQEKLLAQMEYARFEHETAMLREQLRAREMDMGRQKREWEMKEQQAEESRRRTEEQMRRQQEEMESRMLHQEEEMRRRQQENNLFMQAQQLDNMLKDQGGYDDAHDTPPMAPESNSYERRGFDGGHMRGGGHMGGRGHWGNDNFSNKRRRY